MVSKLCSRSQGQPSGARSRAMIPTRRSNLSPVVVGLVGIAGRWNSHCGTGVLVCVRSLHQNTEWIERCGRGVHFWDWVRLVILLFVVAFGFRVAARIACLIKYRIILAVGEPG